LIAYTRYYVRAYGTNSAGTIYGREITFTTNFTGYIGNFVINKATVSAPTNLSTVQGIPVPIIAGMDITTMIQQTLLSAVKCASAAKSWVELRKDKSIYMSCEGTNAFFAGTWEEINTKTLKLNMNSTAIPSSPSGLVLTVTDIVHIPNGWQGKTSIQMPKETFASDLAAIGLTIAATPAFYMVHFSIDFVSK